MSIIARALADRINGPAHYAWIITKDHLAEPTNVQADNVWAVEDAAGTTGPSDAPQELLDRLLAGEGNTFRMYDDDQELYYTGRGLALKDEWDERACFGPVDDFGAPNAGAIWIRWHGHPERDNG